MRLRFWRFVVMQLEGALRRADYRRHCALPVHKRSLLFRYKTEPEVVKARAQMGL